MAFNFGAFAGGLAKGGSDTYFKLKEQEKLDAAEARDKERFDAWRGEQKSKEAIRVAAGETPEGDTVLMPSYEGVTGGIDTAEPKMVPQPITPDQKAANFRQRALALGATPTDLQQYELGSVQLRGAKQGLEKGEIDIRSLRRSADFDARFDGVMKSLHGDSAARLNDITTTAQTSGMRGLVEKFGPEIKKAFGADAQLVGNNIVIKAKGQPTQTIGSIDQAVKALQGLAEREFGQNLEQRFIKEGLFKTPAELATYLQNRTKNDIDARTVAAREALVPSEILRNTASANQSNASAGASNAVANATRAALENREQIAALMQQYDALSPEEQAGPKGLAIVQKFNLLNVKAGATVPLGAKGGSRGGGLTQPVDIKKNDDGTFTAYSKDGGQALYNMYNGEQIPLGMDVATFQQMKKAAKDNGVKLFSADVGGRLVLKYVGPDGKPYDDPETAKYSKAEKKPGADSKAAEGPEPPKKSAIPLSAKGTDNFERQDRVARDALSPITPKGVGRGMGSGSGTGFLYRGNTYPTRDAAEAARKAYIETGKLPQ
jgi:hypothetical protein